MVFGDTLNLDETIGRSAPFYFLTMKKIFLLISLCISSLCTIHAEITCTLSDDGTLTISGTDMSTYYPWYSQRAKVKKIVIKSGVTNIGDYAFQDCSNLTSIIIPNTVTSIGDHAFYGCSKLTSITIPNSVISIGGYAFYECSSLTSISIPNSVSNIGIFTFRSCSSLTSVSIPNSVTSIEGDAFWGCSNLTSVTIPNSVTSIGGGAFQDCSHLSSISIPNSVTNVGEGAFNNTQWYDNQPDGLVYAGLVLYKYKGSMPENANIIIKEGIKSITVSAFSGYNNLTSITIPKSVTRIGEEAFYDCSGLTSIICEASTPPICGWYCFWNVNNYGLILYVPQNSIEAYKEWGFSNIRAIIDNQSIANAVIEKIEAIGKVEYTDVCKGKIDEANTAYDALTDEQKALVTNLDVLTTAQQTYDNLKAAAEKLAADKAAANKVINKIKAIGTVEYTEACKKKIDAASTAYNALTADQKALVTNLDVLTTAQQTYDNLKVAAEKLAADKAAANKVINKIKAIGTVEYTEACKKKIDAASTAYNALTADQKALVTNLKVLTTAQQTYDNLKAAAEKLAADKAAANAVIAKINAIGKVEYTYACRDKIDEANNAYNALTADQKALVTNLDVLTLAKQTYDNLKAAADKLAADKDAFDKYKIEIIVIIESLVKEDDSDAVRAIINKAIIDIDALKYEEVISLDDNKEKVNNFVTSVNEAVEKQRAEDQKTTGIDELELAEKVNIYDLNGRKITNSMLKSGLYIKNGKKVVVK